MEGKKKKKAGLHDLVRFASGLFFSSAAVIFFSIAVTAVYYYDSLWSDHLLILFT